MANIQIVETSLRDGNQCLWGALGVTTANTLTIAPAMERAGYRAIDFTTSTHMGVAVRYKREDPWERIRAMAEICRETPLQFLSTGFRFIAWETASPEFMELAFRTLATNGIRRFALADPNNDAASNVEVARLVRRAGGDQVIGALVYSISPIHDDAHYAAAGALHRDHAEVGRFEAGRLGQADRAMVVQFQGLVADLRQDRRDQGLRALRR